MAYEDIVTLECIRTIALGGFDKKTGKDNPKKIEGFFLGTKIVDMKKGGKTSKVHVFLTTEGNIGVWGKTHLDRQMADAKANTMTEVLQDGMQETENNPMYLYRVRQDKSRTIDGVSEAPDPISNSKESDEGDLSLFESLGEDEDAMESYAPAPVARPAARTDASLSSDSLAKVKAALAARQRSA